MGDVRDLKLGIDFPDAVKALGKFFSIGRNEAAEPDAIIELASGEPKEIEVARSGTFYAAKGGRTTLTPDILAGYANRFQAAEEHWLKIGHGPVTDTTPDYGDVVALAYDPEADRLKATVVPTEALVEKNRKEGFRRVSMELGMGESGSRKVEDLNFMHLAFLGKHPPAIDGLEAVAFAGSEAQEPVFVFAEGEPEKGVDLGFSMTSADGGLTNVLSSAPSENTDLAEATEETSRMDEKKLSDLEADIKAKDADLALAKERIAAFERQAKETAANAARAFVAANEKRIPMLARQAGLETGLAALLAYEATASNAPTFDFAAAGSEGSEIKKSTASQILMAVFAALPEQVEEKETKETATKGVELGAVPTEAEIRKEFKTELPIDEASVKVHLAVKAEQEKAKSEGNVIDYMEAVRRVQAAGRK